MFGIHELTHPLPHQLQASTKPACVVSLWPPIIFLSLSDAGLSSWKGIALAALAVFLSKDRPITFVTDYSCRHTTIHNSELLTTYPSPVASSSTRQLYAPHTSHKNKKTYVPRIQRLRACNARRRRHPAGESSKSSKTDERRLLI